MFNKTNNKKLLNKLMLVIGIDSAIIFVLFLWACYFSLAMSIPKMAVHLVWLQSIPIFILLGTLTWIGIEKIYVLLPIIASFAPLFLLYGILGPSGISYTLRGITLFFLDANLLGILEIILALVLYFSFFLWIKYSNNARPN